MTKRKAKPRDYDDVVARSGYDDAVADMATELMLWFAGKGDLGHCAVPAMATVIVAMTRANAISTGRGDEHFKKGIEIACCMLRDRMDAVLKNKP
jgi:hypothetical protein